LYFKMKKDNFIIDYIILLKTYYDLLYGKIKINSQFSKLFKLARCVKQGGILSGALFNFYIYDLIKECAESGLGAMLIDIVMCILGFCDDSWFWSQVIEDLQKLLDICGNYSNKWGIEFKDNSRSLEINDQLELIKICLENNQDSIMITQLNFLTYAGPIKLNNYFINL
jgi:hypothetical protein